MTSQCFVMNVNRAAEPNKNENGSKPSVSIEKVMSYEEKSVGSTNFFKCEACPYMALAEDDIKFHLFTEHPELAKKNGLADNIKIPCPGCTSIFDAEETLRIHLRNHHKMGIKDVKKMVKSLVQLALKNVKLKKEVRSNDLPPAPQDVAEIKMPQIIEIVPEFNNSINEHLPKGVAYISVDELNKMSMPNFEKVDPKEVIQEASINIVYANNISTQYMNVSNANTSNTGCNVIQVSSVTPDLISSIQPCITSKDKLPPQPKDVNPSDLSPQRTEARLMPYPLNYKERKIKEDPEKDGVLCSVNKCRIRLKDPNNLSYHRKCHLNGKLKCPECPTIFLSVEVLHTHLWKIHAVDLELQTCDVCDYKTFKRHRLLNIHMKCHRNIKVYLCSVCNKSFKTANQLSKHRLIHKKGIRAQCHICEKWFNSEPKLQIHITTVHDKLKPFKCGHCDYTAARKGELKLHLRSHTGDKPYACDQCNYRSSDHNAMRRHKKMHSKQGIYKCKYCSYTSIQSTSFASHMMSNHHNVSTKDIHRCPYCPFKSINKEKYVVHLTTHRDKEGVKLLIGMTNGKSNKPSWTIPSESSEKCPDMPNNEDDQDSITSTRVANSIVNSIPIEVYDCDSLPETLTQEYSKNFDNDSASDTQPPDFNTQVDIVTDFNMDDNNSDCLLSNSTLPNLHFLNTSVVSMEQDLIQSNNINSLAPIHSPISTSISNNIMCNFPIRLPLASPPIRPNNNITLKPVDKICIPMTKFTGPIINPMQILPVPSSHSPINISTEMEGVPRKKPKISVKSNLILKGPDQVNMFHSQQQMAFKRLEDNERFGLSSPVVTFNNLIMQLQPEPALSESPNNMMSYPQDNLGDNAPTPLDSDINGDPQIFSFNPQMNVNSMNMLPQAQKIQSNDPSYIKLEATIKQNTQSPSLERMCNPILLNNQGIAREYKASPPLEEIHKNVNEIKNEVKSDAFYNIPLNSTANNPPTIDQYLIDNIIPEQYSSHIDLSSVVLPEADQQNDVIEIDDNSDDNKLLSRFDMNCSLESLYLIHNDFHFLENEVINNASSDAVNEMNRMVTEVPIINQKDCLEVLPMETNHECTTLIQGKRDPMMNTSGKQTTNKINVKNIELMKN